MIEADLLHKINFYYIVKDIAILKCRKKNFEMCIFYERQSTVVLWIIITNNQLF